MSEPDLRLVELAQHTFVLARQSSGPECATYVEAGVLVDLTDASRETAMGFEPGDALDLLGSRGQG